MKLVYPAVFTPFENGTGFTVVVPDLPGCVTEGNSLVEAIEMGVDAASGWILGEIEDGNGYPASTDILSSSIPEGSFVNLLVLDIDAYSEKYGDKAVRRNITVPAWLDTYAQKNHLSLSKVVQDTLMKLAQK